MRPSPREIEVLQLIAKGQSSEQIAQNLNLTISTIESHRRNLFKKAKVQSVVSLIMVALKNKWIDINLK
jgi:DNA-binding NarL/FixJ family response regulator